MKEYHDFYLKCDVLLLTDIFERSINRSLKIMGYVQVIIWAHQLKSGMQCLIWQKLSLNLFQMLTCNYSLKKGMRDGVSFIFKIYSKAKNKYLKSYDLKRNQNISYTHMQIIYVVIRFLSFFKHLDLNG